MQMNDGSTCEAPDEEKGKADQEERYCFKSESANLDMCSITYVFSPSPLCVFVYVCVCRSACVSGILKKRQILQDYLDLHRDLICLIVKIVLVTGTFFLFFKFPH